MKAPPRPKSMTIDGRDRRHHGRKVEAVRWTVRMASQEFDWDHHTVSKKIKRAGVLPGTDSCYSTKDIVTALFGGTDAELQVAKIDDLQKSAKLKDSRDKILNKKFIDVTMVELVWCNWIRDLADKVKNLNLPEADRVSILKDLVAIPIERYYSTKEMKEDDDEMEEAT